MSRSDTYLPPDGTPVRSLALDGRRRLTRRPVDVATTCAYVERL